MQDIWETIKTISTEAETISLQKLLNKDQWQVEVIDKGARSYYVFDSFCGAAQRYLTLTNQPDDGKY